MQAYIVAALRTAGGKRGGRLSGWHPADLSAQVINALIEQTSADPARVEDVIWGCVSQVGQQASNIARNAVLSSVLPESVPGTSVDRQCGSSQQALHFAAQAVMSGSMDVVIAGGVESMSRVPMFSPNTLADEAGLGGYVGAQVAQRYPGVVFSQFAGAEQMARKYSLRREDLDAYALQSHQRATAARSHWGGQIVPVAAHSAEAGELGEPHTQDEGVRANATLEGIASVKTLQDGGVISAANASQICDGASGVMVVNERGLQALGVPPLARVHHMSILGHDPVIMLEAPIPATQRALQKIGLRLQDIDLYEVNEAFASVALAWQKALGADPARLNAEGGAIALGHPLGASGTRLATTLIHALQRSGGRYGLQTMCEGGGMANVTVFERC
jgi:acetyl-CoA C-acetyltransferase